MASPWNEGLLVTGTSCWLPQEGAKTTIGQFFRENTTRLTVGFTNGDTVPSGVMKPGLEHPPISDDFPFAN